MFLLFLFPLKDIFYIHLNKQMSSFTRVKDFSHALFILSSVKLHFEQQWLKSNNKTCILLLQRSCEFLIPKKFFFYFLTIFNNNLTEFSGFFLT